MTMAERGRDRGGATSGNGVFTGVTALDSVPAGGGASPFLAGAYAMMAARSIVFSRVLSRAMGTILLLSFPPHSFQQHTHTHMHTVFSDAAPCGHRFNVVGRGSWLLPRLPLPAVGPPHAAGRDVRCIYAHKCTAGCHLPSVAIGIDDDTMRLQTMHLEAGTSCSVQLRLLRPIF